MNGSFLFLGTGGSMGVPVIGCDCPVCTSSSHLNKRLRTSALLTFGNQKILIDAGPDFRSQALSNNLDRLDGVMFTHAHHDHTAGIDELRVYYMYSKEPLPCLMSNDTYTDLKTRFDYIFTTKMEKEKLVPRLKIHLLESERGNVNFLGHKVLYFTYEQAGMAVNGYRIGNLAYVSDIRNYPPTIFEDLKGVTHLILSALRFTPSPLHLSVDEAIDFGKRAGAKHTWLTHIAHEIDHAKAEEYLPPNFRIAYDGLKIPLEE